MEVRRLDIFDFKLCLTEAEFNLFKFLADKRNTDIEVIITTIIDDGLSGLIEDLE